MVTGPANGATIEAELESHRRALTGYCYRLLGSGAEAEDAVQEAMTRAWRNADRLEARGALKAWLYRIASNVCFDMLDGTERRAQPMDLGPSSTAGAALGAALPEHAWVQPIADARVLPGETDPAEIVESRETLRLAFVAALQHLPARQRAVLVLREVLRWPASEVAELLETSVASVNSALQRARATLSSLDLEAGAAGPVAVEGTQRELLAGYVDAFERYDMSSLVSLLKRDVAFSMPPFPLWLTGPAEVRDFMLGQGIHCRGSRLIPTAANGGPAVGVYHPTPAGHFEPWAIVVLEVSEGRISGLHHFLSADLFAAFGLPPRLDADHAREAEQVEQPA
jgi:RNA polymerase sigma-70 factor, ECF subfamily